MELGRIRSGDALFRVTVMNVSTEYIRNCLPEFDTVCIKDSELPFFGVSTTRRVKNKKQLNNLCEKFTGDINVVSLSAIKIGEYLDKKQPIQVFISAIVDSVFEKRLNVYEKFFARHGYRRISCLVIDEESNTFPACYWLLEKNPKKYYKE